MHWIATLCVLVACTRSATVHVEPPPPLAPVDAPTLAVIAPERGAFVDAGLLAVSGRVADDGDVRVTVNGVDAVIAADGTFTASVAVTSGMAVVETHAIDTTGHDVREVRAVLVGPFAPTDGSVRALIGASLGPAGLTALATGLVASLKATDFTAAARAIGPLFERDGCLGARGEIANITIGQLGLALTPKPGAIAAIVTAGAVTVGVNARYTLACLDGDTTITVRTNARAHGDLRAVLVGGRIHTAFDATVDLDDFQVEIPGVPGPVERLLRGLVRLSVERALAGVLAQKVPPLADARLAELLSRPPAAMLLGRDLRVAIVPRRLELAPSGVVVAADATFVVAGGQRGRYVTAPARIAGTARADLGVWIAADAVNQMLAGLWAAHAFDRSVAIADVGVLAMFLPSDVRTIEIGFALPPTASVGANGELVLAIGELGMTLRGADQIELQRFAVALRSVLAVEPGGVALTASSPTVVAQLLAQHASTERPLDRDVVEGVVKTVWSLVAGSLNGALAGISLPSAGVALDLRRLTGQNGMFVLELSPHAL